MWTNCMHNMTRDTQHEQYGKEHMHCIHNINMDTLLQSVDRDKHRYTMGNVTHNTKYRQGKTGCTISTWTYFMDHIDLYLAEPFLLIYHFNDHSFMYNYFLHRGSKFLPPLLNKARVILCLSHACPIQQVYHGFAFPA